MDTLSNDVNALNQQLAKTKNSSKHLANQQQLATQQLNNEINQVGFLQSVFLNVVCSMTPIMGALW